MTRLVSRALTVLACSALMFATACGDDDDSSKTDSGSPNGKDGGGDGDGGGGGMDASTADSGSGDSGTVTPPAALMCGGDPCMVSSGAAMLGTAACCTDDDECGGQSAIFSSCIPLGSPGSYDETCPGFSIDVGFPLNFPGCCTPAGQCGALDGSEGGFGCIPGDALPDDADGGVASQGCTYDPNSTCTAIVVATCDGAEDCPSGKQCCSSAFDFTAGYGKVSCEDSCVELAAGGDIVSQVCHPGESCDAPLPSDAGTPGTTTTLPDGGAVPYTCLDSMYLPPFLYRCRDMGNEPTTTGSTAAGEINCGDDVCGSGEKCCYAVSPGGTDNVAHCVGVDEPCTCSASSSSDDKDAGG